MRSRPHSCAAFAREWARKPEGWKARESNVNPSGRHPSCLTNRICLIRNRNPQNYGTDSAIIRPQIYLIILPRILVTFRSAAQPIHECDPSVLRRWTDSHSSGARQQPHDWGKHQKYGKFEKKPEPSHHSSLTSTLPAPLPAPSHNLGGSRHCA
jgi:hypothetical protein